MPDTPERDDARQLSCGSSLYIYLKARPPSLDLPLLVKTHTKAPMARRQKDSSSLGILFEVATLVPWPVSLVLALVIYVGLHWYASSPPPVLQLNNPAASGGIIAIKAIAGLAQYLIPLVILFGAVTAFFRRKKQQSNHRQVAADPAPNALEKMSWLEFEGLVAETFRQKGYRVVGRGGDGADGGIDIEMFMGKDRYLVQCKQWKTRQVGVAIVRELYGVMAAEGAVGGFVVASGSFTPDAAEFASGKSIELVDARKLRRLIGGHQVTKAVPQIPSVTSPACPVCGSHMLERTVGRGAKVGNKFWGCSNYPRCKGVRN